MLDEGAAPGAAGTGGDVPAGSDATAPPAPPALGPDADGAAGMVVVLDDMTAPSSDARSGQEPAGLADRGAQDGHGDTRALRPRATLGWILLGLGALILLAAAWVGVRSVQAYRHLQDAQRIALTIENEFDQHGISRPEALIHWAQRFRIEADGARSAVQDPLFRAATVTPWLGDNLAAVRTIALSVDDIATALEPGAELAGSLDAGHLFPHRGAVDLTTVTAAAHVLAATDSAVQRAMASLQAVDTRSLVGPVAEAVTLLRDRLADVAPLTAAGSRLGHLVVPMLGAGGPRTYLVVFQNPSELRATGGIFGSYAVLRVDDGAVTLQRTGSTSRDLGTFDARTVGLDPAMRELYSSRMGTYPQDVNFTPDFPTAAELLGSMYMQRFGARMDGVVALDPLVVAMLLQGQRPIDLGDGVSLTSQTAAELLMSGIYRLFPTSVDSDRRDAFLAAATVAAFRAIVSGQDPGAFRSIISGIKDMVDQRRVLVWSSHPQEEALILPTAVSGRLPRDAVGAPTVGVFLNDGTGGKLDYYLTMTAHLGAGTCFPTPAGRSASSPLTVRLGFDAPTGDLPNYVISGGNVGRSVYRLQTNVVLVAPTGGTVTDVQVDGRSVPVRHGVDHGRSVTMATVVLTPGRAVDLAAAVRYPVAGTVAVTPRLVVTPMARQADAAADSFTTCAGHGS